ncbi:mannitol dehydrogenase family protein [Myceligenerans cantabricum]
MSEANDVRLTRDGVSGIGTATGVAGPVHPERIGIVHLGIGAFHRAHQAVYTERAMAATGDLTWGVLGVTQRSATVRDQLRPQGGVYGVLTAGAVDDGTAGPVGTGGLAVGDGLRLDLVGAVLDVAYPAEETERVLSTVAAPTTHVVTLTITEKGYARLPGGGLDVTRVQPDLDALAAGSDPGPVPGPGRGGGPDGRSRASAGPDGVAPPAPASSAIGLLVRGIAARQRAGAAPLTVLTCDNMVENGRVLERLVHEAVDAALPGEAGAALRSYLDERVTFPCSMVDRIVPATTPEQRDLVQGALGVRDEGLVVGEPFTQWVIEDRFAGPRPAWERAGATLTDDVASFEQAKLRLLNGTHSLVAYAGALAGHATIAEAVADPVIADHARAYLFDDALPTLAAPRGLDLREYGEEILRRFANPHTGHTTIQVAMDGTQKIPFRWGGTLADALAAGRVPRGLAFGLVSWALFVRRRTLAAAGRAADVPGGGGQGVDDPRADELADLVEGTAEPGGTTTPGGTTAGTSSPASADVSVDTADVVRRLVALPGLLPATNDDLVKEVVAGACG